MLRISDINITNLAPGFWMIGYCRVRLQLRKDMRRRLKIKIPSRFQVQPMRKTRRHGETKVPSRFQVWQMRVTGRPVATGSSCGLWVEQMRDTRGSGKADVLRMMYAFANFCQFLFEAVILFATGTVELSLNATLVYQFYLVCYMHSPSISHKLEAHALQYLHSS